MSMLSIQLQLLDKLIDENIHSAKELEQNFQVKNSTLRYYITNLILAGFQVESIRGKGGGYKLDKKKCINNLFKLIEK